MSTSALLRPLTELQALESESIHIIREVAATFTSPVMLFSGGKDSVVMLHVAAKAFWPAPIPFGVLHVDTGHNFAEVLEFRDEAAAFYGAQLKVASVQEYLDNGRLRERPDGTRNPLQTVPLDAITEGRHDAVFGGGRRDEAGPAKERVFSMRDEFGQWDPRNQRPNYGRSTTVATCPANTYASSRSQTGPNWTSGTTSSPRKSACRRSTTPTSARSCSATACGSPSPT